MGAEINIATWSNRTTASVGSPAATDRIEKITRDVLNHTLEDALSHADFPTDSLFCFSEVSLQVGFDPDVSLRSQSRAWSDSLRRRLRMLMAGGAGFVRFDSLADAHRQCAEAVLRNDLTLAWAWRQMDLLTIPEGAGPEQVLDLWCQDSVRRGVNQLAVWRYLLHSNALSLVVMRFKPNHWQAHLQGLARTLRCPVEGIEAIVSERWRRDSLRETRDSDQSRRDRHSEDTEDPAVLSRQLTDPGFLACLAQCDRPYACQLLTLAILVTEPGLTAADAKPRKQRIAAVVRAVARRLHGITASHDRRGNESAIAGSAASSAPWADIHPPHQARLKEPFTRISGKQQQIANDAEPDREIFRDDQVSLNLLREQESLARTAYGGIFFLYNILIEQPDLVGSLTQHRLFAQLPAPWIWYWLARQWLPAKHFESAALAFAGLESDRSWTEISVQVPDAQQQIRLTEVAAAIRERALERLRETGNVPATPFDDLIRRRAQLEWDGPWMRVHFAMNDVDVNVRRAGLDADPGFLAWIGSVVVFAYE